MSSTLYFQPAQAGRKSLAPEVKLALRAWLSDPLPERFTIQQGDKTSAFLAGLAYCKVPGAQDLLDAIGKWEEVEIFEKW